VSTPSTAVPPSGGRARAALLGAIRFYQRAVSPTRPPRCRFVPSCSAYALEAVERHGAARGTWLAVRRLAKCAPWHPGGVDLVPEVAEPAPSRLPGTSRAARSSSPAAPTADRADASPSAGPGPLAGLRAGPVAGDLR
jgi:putative membrane protein insertion efficiency factor